jgi:acetylornithine aminotransferase
VLATLRVIEEEGLVERAAKTGAWLAEELRPLGAEVRGAGMLIGLDLGEPKANAVVKAALQRRLIVNDVTPTTVRVAPPLILSDGEADEGVKRLREAVNEVMA